MLPLVSSQSLHWLLPSKSASTPGLHAAQPLVSEPSQSSSTPLLQTSAAAGLIALFASLQSSRAALVEPGHTATGGAPKASVASQKPSPSSSQPSSTMLLQLSSSPSHRSCAAGNAATALHSSPR